MTDQHALHGKRVVITGGSKGLDGIISVLAMPTVLNPDLVEMRSAIPWFPELG
ncbi:MAG: hypothetical protein V4579_10900 [Pseudomonadota bacterium]